MTTEQRTEKQNNALHQYFTDLAEALNAAGYDVRRVMKEIPAEIPFTGWGVKNFLWRPFQKVYLGKRSTTELTRQEVGEMYEAFNAYLAKFGIHVPFPSEESMVEKIAEKIK